MGMGMDRCEPAGSAEAIAQLADELSRTARLAREQAAALAHYKKMYDRSSALARIGVWECDLATEKLTWTDGVYDLFEMPRGSPIDRARDRAMLRRGIAPRDGAAARRGDRARRQLQPRHPDPHRSGQSSDGCA